MINLYSGSSHASAIDALKRAIASGGYVGLKMKGRGGGWRVTADSVRKRNAGRKMTKTQRKAAASVRAKKTRIAKAVKGLLKQTNPAGKFAGAKIRRNKGSITIIPVRLPKRASR